MSVRVWLAALSVLAVAACSSGAPPPSPTSATTTTKLAADALVVTIPGFAESAFLAKRHEDNSGTCSGSNLSPPIAWSNWPATTKSFAVLVSDPDGSRGRGSTHWIVYNIPLTTTSLREGAGSAGEAGFTQGKNQSGQEFYRGPCPRVGDPAHHYLFSVYALDIEPGSLAPGLDRVAFAAAVAEHAVGYSSVVLRYAR